jgi:chromosome segregation ATPase
MDKTTTLAYALHQLANCNLFDRNVMKQCGDELLRLSEENERLKNERDFVLAEGGQSQWVQWKERAERAEAELAAVKESAIDWAARCGETQAQLERIVDELEEVKAERDELKAKLYRYEVNPGLAKEYIRLDTMWQELVKERDQAYRKGMLRASETMRARAARYYNEEAAAALRLSAQKVEEEANK